MSHSYKTWPHKWFGFWKENGPGYEKCPSIRDFIDPEAHETLQIDKVLSYLDSSLMIAATSRMNFPHPITGEVLGGSLISMTDGEYYFRNPIIEYIRDYSLMIPLNWYRLMEEREFIVPELNYQEVFPKLERPILAKN